MYKSPTRYRIADVNKIVCRVDALGSSDPIWLTILIWVWATTGNASLPVVYYGWLESTLGCHAARFIEWRINLNSSFCSLDSPLFFHRLWWLIITHSHPSPPVCSNRHPFTTDYLKLIYTACFEFYGAE